MSKETAGLSFQEAAALALEEEAAAAESPESADEGLVIEPASEGEQPNVEDSADDGVFSNLRTNKPEGNQPDDQELHEVKVQGEMLKVTLEELKNGYSRHADYTRDKQALAKLEADHEQAITFFNMWQSDPQAMLVKLNEKFGGGKPVYKPQGQPQAPDIEALIEEKIQERLANDPRLQTYEQDLIMRELEGYFSQIEEDYKLPRKLTKDDKQLILEKAQSEGITNLDTAFKLLQYEQSQIEAQRRNLENVSTSQGRRSGDEDDSTPEPQKFSSFKEAWDKVLAESGSV